MLKAEVTQLNIFKHPHLSNRLATIFSTIWRCKTLDLNTHVYAYQIRALPMLHHPRIKKHTTPTMNTELVPIPLTAKGVRLQNIGALCEDQIAAQRVDQQITVAAADGAGAGNGLLLCERRCESNGVAHGAAVAACGVACGLWIVGFNISLL